MESHLLLKIDSCSPNFSKGQRLIANYIEDNYDKAAFMTASKLGSTVGVSESTVVRFATELGYKGYPELQKSMQDMIKNRLTSIQRLEISSSRMGDKDILSSVLNQDIDKIKRTLEETSHKDFYNAVADIVASKRIYIVAARSTSALAGFMGFYFNLMFDNIKVINAANDSEMYEKMMRISQDDVVIGISFPRYSKRAVKAMEFAADKGACVIAITDSKDSPLIPPAKHVLLAYSGMAGIVDSLVAPLSVINALIVAIAMNKRKDVSEALRNLESIWEKYDVFEKVEEVYR